MASVFRRRGRGILPRNLRGHGTPPHPARRPRPARARRARRRARLLRRDLPRGRVGARTASPTDFVQDNHSRSRRGTLRGIHFQTHPGQGKLVRVARGRVLDVVVDLRRGSPTFGEWEAFELDDERGHQLWIPVGFGHGFCVLSERPTSSTSAPTTTTRRPRRASGSTIPTSGSSGRGRRAALLRARPRRAAAGRDRGLRCRSATRERPTAASPRARPARCTSATCARRCSRGCSRARRARASWCGWRTSTRAACGRVRRASSSRTCAAIGLDWDGEVVCQSARRDAVRRTRSTRCGRTGRVYECFCTRAEIRAASSAPHGPLPEGAYPGTCLRLTRGRARAQARAAGARRRCACAPTRARIALHRPAARARRRAWSTTSSCAATTARPPTTWRSSSTTPRRASARSCAAPTCSTRRRGSSCSPALLGLPEPAYAHVPLVLGPDGARLAKRHGDVTLREVLARATRVRWMARSLGLRGRGAGARCSRRSTRRAAARADPVFGNQLALSAVEGT